ncbi:hypothetical protein N2603_43245 [Bradyrhizobium huanghuaihaiense]|uniref:hypothetical protein n=1 Tax=Bradyrhizobium huanghuaihaiense TaxID=990078 RepID=UPI0021AA4198|nr:hypothetical protein [Bradyrhizobium sp. CB3035]UWU76605.1 hypothetical protein N2603_43245 [Bradyrhizobium sp. CB3035]
MLSHWRGEAWPAWIKNGNLPTPPSFPATNIFGDIEAVDGYPPHRKVIVHFTYSGIPFTLIFVDEGTSPYSSDGTRYGKAEFLVASDRVLGIDISAKYDPNWDSWTFSDVFAFSPGDWMKYLVEIAALIDAHQTRRHDGFFDDDAIRRASQIKL